MKLNSAWNRFGRAIAFSAVICALVFIGCTVLRSKGKLEYLESKMYDWVTVERGRGPDLDNVVLVGIDERDLRWMQHYPLSDQDKADLIQRLEDCKARVIGVDIYTDLTVDNEGRERLKERLTRNRNVVCAEYWGDAKSNEPEIPAVFLPRGRRVGFVDQVRDNDGVVRRGLLYLSFVHTAPSAPGAGPTVQDWRAEPSLSINVANKFLEAAGTLKPDPQDLIHVNKLWSQRIPRLQAWEGPYGDDVEQGGYQYLVKYDGPQEFKTYTLQDVMLRMDMAAGQKAFGGKAVIVGMTADSVKDKVNTPLQSEQWGAKQHVRLVDQLIRIAGGASPLRTLPWKKGMAWTLIWTLLAGVVGYRLRNVGWLLLFALAGLASIIGTALLAVRHDLLVPVVPPSLCWLVSLAGVTAYMVQLESSDRRTIRELFGKAVPKEVADEMWEHRSEMIGDGVLKPREGTATLLFADLQGFTTLAEYMKPAELIRWLNEYLAAMTDIVAAHHGIVVKYMGDGMMVAFGMPLSCGELADARHAVACAIQMRSKLSELRARWGSEDRPAPKLRVGIFTGPAIAGSVGSPRRQEYTVLGDTTNTAARLEGFNKELMDDEVAPGGCRVLIGESTYRHVADLVKVRLIGQSHLTGRDQTVAIYAVLGPADIGSETGKFAVSANPRDAGSSGCSLEVPFASESK